MKVVHTEDALRGLGANPALPAELLRPLLECGVPGRVAAHLRENLPRGLAEELAASGREEVLCWLAGTPNLPADVHRALAAHPGDAVRWRLTRVAGELPPDVLDLLVADPDTQVRQFLAKNEHTPAGTLARLAEDPDPEVRAELAQWWVSAPEDVRRGLLADPEPKVRKAACSTYFRRLPHPVPPPDLHPALLADPATRAGVVAHLDPLTPEAASALAADEDEDVRGAVAAHPQLPAALRDALARDADPIVRAAVLVREDTPEELRAETYAYLTEGAARAGRFREGYAAGDEDVFCQVALAGLDFSTIAWVRADPLPHVDSPYPFLRHSAACGEGLPPEAVAGLLDDEDQYVRLVTVMRHGARLDPSSVERVERAHRDTRKPADRPSDGYAYPPAYLRRFAADRDPRIRELAPRDPDLPAGLLEELATDPEPRVRRAVADHPRLPLAHLLALVADDDRQVAEAAGRNPALPVAEMARIIAEHAPATSAD
ncbi:hypothetical protein ACGFMM_08145 [Streptomyces sp. NPDC048604]|uniref:hypothetical protein n=1 Tax=Streptomyces sp. NPDC048604 TaxID=3365578 RepID=UPI0037156300